MKTTIKALLIIAAMFAVPFAWAQDNIYYPTAASNGGQIIASVASTGACPTGSCVGITLSATAAVITVGVTGTFSDTLQPEESQNGGYTWTSAGTAITTTGTTSYVVAGFTTFRVRASAHVSGVANVNLVPSTAPSGSVTSGTADPTGTSCAPNALYVQTTTGNLYTCDAGVFAIVSGGGGGITGSGTANSIAVFTGATSIGNSEMTDDGAGLITANAFFEVADLQVFSLGEQVNQWWTFPAGGAITNGKLVKFSGTGSEIILTTTGDTTGIIGVTGGVSGTTSPGDPVSVSRFGGISAVLDNSGACTALEPIVNSPTVAGDGHCTATPGSAQVVGVFLNDPGNFNMDVYPQVNVTTLVSSTNCSSGASPAVCGSAASGSIAVPTGASPTLVVNTTAVTANSQILLTIDESLGTKLSVTCNTTLATLVQPVVTARTAATSFTIQINATLATNPACVSYTIIN